MWPNTTSAILGDNDTIRSLENFELQQLDIPTVVFLATLSVLGTIGNVHTLLVYTLSPELKKLPVRMLIICLSSTDLIVCTACVPFEICDIRFDYTFSSVGACKFFRYLLHATAVSSCLFLVTIAIQRFQIIFRKYFPRDNKPEKIFNIAAIIIICVSVLHAIPAFVYYGVVIKESPFKELNGTDCQIKYKYQNISTYGVFIGIMMLIITISFMMIVVLYSKILYLIYSQMKKNSAIHLNEIPEDPDDVPSVVQTEEKTQMQIRFENSRQLTISLIVATAVSYFGYIVHALAALIHITNPHLVEKNKVPPGGKILFLAHFINNAANPVVYCLLDKKFRKEYIELYRNSVVRRITNTS